VSRSIAGCCNAKYRGETEKTIVFFGEGLKKIAHRIFVCRIYPLTLRTLPYFICDEQREKTIPNFVTAVGIIPSPLCFTTQNIGEKQRSGSDDERG
jgi:hypothetical protein